MWLITGYKRLKRLLATPEEREGVFTTSVGAPSWRRRGWCLGRAQCLQHRVHCAPERPACRPACAGFSLLHYMTQGYQPISDSSLLPCPPVCAPWQVWICCRPLFKKNISKLRHRSRKSSFLGNHLVLKIQYVLCV